jgi:hypothetical protein
MIIVILVYGAMFIPLNLFAQGTPPARVPVGSPVQFDRYNPQYYSLPIGPLPLARAAPAKDGGIQIGVSFDGSAFLGSNCGCFPPDTNAAVANGFVVETVNLEFSVFDHATGVALRDEPLETFFGALSGGDPYVVYDDIADRWYVSAFDSHASGLFLAVSADGNPLHRFHIFDLTEVGGFPDFPKPGFNKDAIFISYNAFGNRDGDAAIVAIDKEAALSGKLTYFVSHPRSQFRAMPPAQMHGDNKGGVEWFVSTDGTDAGGATIRVTEMTNYLSNDPHFTYTSLPVTRYEYALQADQPGGFVTTFPNTTTTQLQYHRGHLVTAMASGIASGGFDYPKGLYYQIDVKRGRPRLLKQGTIDPGPKVAVQMPSVVEDRQGNLGLTWMQSSISEYLSMWAGTLSDRDGRCGTRRVDNGGFSEIEPGDRWPREPCRPSRSGPLSAKPVARGQAFLYANSRIGDYSTVVLDPSDDRTFWAANEYIGPKSDAKNIWRTRITSFSANRVHRFVGSSSSLSSW